MSVEIRRADLSDAASLAEIEQTRPFAAGWKLGGIESELKLENSVLFIALCNGIAAGFIALKILPPQAEIANLAVSQSFERRGIGLSLLDCSIKYAAGQACSKMFLEVNTGNAPAAGLYEKRGFKKAALRKKFYSDGSDAYTMILEM